MGEFELIRRYFSPLSAISVPSESASRLELGPGDDCAIQRVAAGWQPVFSVDTLVEGVHFPKDYAPHRLGYRALAVAASDLAAMGADPVCFTLALTLPDADKRWLKDFSAGLHEAATEFGLPLAGGDTTRGPLTLSIQVHGTVPEGAAILRGGAEPGDLILVSGSLGDAGAALDLLTVSAPTPDQQALLNRYHRPSPRLSLGRELRGIASAAIDVSDGLLADLQHILDASGVGAELDADAVPLSSAIVDSRSDALEVALTAGDDYELCVTLPESHWRRLTESVRQQLTLIGKITEASGLVIRQNGQRRDIACRGYTHFE